MRGLNFLLVEDHELERDSVVAVLRSLHAENIHTARDGRAALHLLSEVERLPDVIICDLNMPGMDGMEFIRHLATARNRASLIVASGLERRLLSAVELMVREYGLPFLGTIEKPVTANKLEEMLLHHTAMPAQPQKLERAAPSFTVEEIVHGLENDEFHPFFQPKVEIPNGRVKGVEALARWRHPQQGLVAAHAFIQQLEECGQIDALMRCMVRKAAAFSSRLRSVGHVCSVAVNVSLRSLSDVTFAEQITQIVRSQNAEPSDITIELTESAVATEVAIMLENLARLRMKGFGLSIDDYGTGYSSMKQLTRVPFTELKIDQSFVTHAGRVDSARVILESSLDMARKLEVEAVAEGVETLENWDLLCELKCDIAHGHYIAAPMGPQTCLSWLRDGRILRQS
jgi:EAL domain-containing protein (putative c-di-GMP-specific phosphodiesterase class I)/AmiR/NasT family two-component response regulator